MRRRCFLALGCLALSLTAPHSTRAAVTEAEAVGYGGTTAGGWACGPVGRANYGGVAARVRMAERAARHGGGGGLLEVGGAAEYEAVKIIDCRGDDPCEGPPPERVLVGSHFRVGYIGLLSNEGHSLGVEGGLTAYQGWRTASGGTPAVHAFPDLEVAYRHQHDAFRIVAGFGSPSVTHYRRPGIYGGTDISVGAADLQLRAGLYRAGPGELDDAELRADAAVVVPVAGAVSVRAGGAAMSGGGNETFEHPGGEGQLGVRAAFR